jgi:hypothetical protein
MIGKNIQPVRGICMSHHSLSPIGGRKEWEAFLALAPVLSEATLSVPIYNRFLRAVQRSQTGSITRERLLLEAGLSFFEESLDVDLALMRLLCEGHLEAVRDRPFTFCVRRINDKGLA